MRSFGAGYAYTYLYPGMQKVAQAAGRVIRTEADRGVLSTCSTIALRAPEVSRLSPRAWWTALDQDRRDIGRYSRARRRRRSGARAGADGRPSVGLKRAKRRRGADVPGAACRFTP